MAVRPLGDDRFMLELAGSVDQKRDMGVRIAAQAMVPWLGRIGAAGELIELGSREVWTVTAGLDVRWGGLSVAPGLHTSKDADRMGWSLLADVHSQPRRGLPSVSYVARIPMEGLGFEEAARHDHASQSRHCTIRASLASSLNHETQEPVLP